MQPDQFHQSFCFDLLLSPWIAGTIRTAISEVVDVLVAAGVRVPITQTDERKPQVLFYFLWDWFDGSLFDFWK